MIHTTADQAAQANLLSAIREDREGRSAVPQDAAPQQDKAEGAEKRGRPAEAPHGAESVEQSDDRAETATESADIEGEEQSKAPDEHDSGGAVEESEEISLADLKQLAEHIGADVADLYDLEIDASVNGKSRKMRLGELKDAAVAVAEANEMRESARQLREQMEAEAKQYQVETQTRIAEAAALVQGLEQQALAQFQGVNWNELRASDPTEWAAKRVELQQAQQAVAQMKAQVAQGLQQYQAQTQKAQQQQIQERLTQERQLLHKAWPEMADEKKAESERARLINFLNKSGFSDEEIGTESDHRRILMYRDAMRWREQAQAQDVAKKRVVKIAKKVLKPGAAPSKSDQSENRPREVAKRLKKSGRHQDFAAWLGEVRRNTR